MATPPVRSERNTASLDELLVFGFIRECEFSNDLYLNIPPGIKKVVISYMPPRRLKWSVYNTEKWKLEDDGYVIKRVGQRMKGPCQGYFCYPESYYGSDGMNKGIHFLKMMPKNFLYLISIVIVSNIILWLICGILFIGWSFRYFHNLDMSLFEIIYQSFHAFCDIFATGTLFVLYINGLSKINEWYLSMQYQEYNKFGESQKMHEILILISRCSVICCVTMVTNLLLIICEFLKNYLFAEHQDYIAVSNIMHTIIVNIDIITYSLAVYMVFDFGYGVYRRLCGCCHEQLRKKCQNRHQRHIQKEYVLMADIDESVDS